MSESLPSTAPSCASDERLYQEIRVRQDTIDNWQKNDPILKTGEFAFVIGSVEAGRLLKIGDGFLRWSQLPWLMATGNDGAVGPAGPAGPGPDVYEQELPPVGPVKDGDVWLQPYTTKNGSDPATIDDLRNEIQQALARLAIPDSSVGQ